MGFNYSIKKPLTGKIEGSSHPYYVDYVMSVVPDDKEYAAHRKASSLFHLIFFLGAPQEDTSWIKEEAEKTSGHLLNQYKFSAARCVPKGNFALELLSHIDPATSGVRIAFKTQEDRFAFIRFEALKYQRLGGIGAANQDVFHAPRPLNGKRIEMIYTDNVPEGSYPTAPRYAFESLQRMTPYKHPRWWQIKAKNEGLPKRGRAPVVATILKAST